jgi:5-methylcytosine-specific restriction endonuclease McrA
MAYENDDSEKQTKEGTISNKEERIKCHLEGVAARLVKAGLITAEERETWIKRAFEGQVAKLERRRRKQKERYGHDWVKFSRYIFESRGEVCEICGKKLEHRSGGYVVHCIDTDHSNRIEENFMLLCPRCHHTGPGGWGSCGTWNRANLIHHIFVVRKGVCEVCGEKLEEHAEGFVVCCKDGDTSNLEYSNLALCCPKCNRFSPVLPTRAGRVWQIEGRWWKSPKSTPRARGGRSDDLI